jgi:hypothetical protein
MRRLESVNVAFHAMVIPSPGMNPSSTDSVTFASFTFGVPAANPTDSPSARHRNTTITRFIPSLLSSLQGDYGGGKRFPESNIFLSNHQKNYPGKTTLKKRQEQTSH